MQAREAEDLLGNYRAELSHGLAQPGLEPMKKDEVVEQVRQVREEQASKLNFNLKAILADARRRQKDSGHPVVSFVTTPKNPG